MTATIISSEWVDRFLLKCYKTWPNGCTCYDTELEVIDPMTVEIYVEALELFNLDDLAKVYKEFLKENRTFFPGVNEVRLKCQEVRIGRSTNQSWDLLVRIIVCYQNRKSLTADEIMAHTIQRMRGVEYLANSFKDENQKYIRSDFQRRYEECVNEYFDGKLGETPLIGNRLAIPVGAHDEKLMLVGEVTIPESKVQKNWEPAKPELHNFIKNLTIDFKKDEWGIAEPKEEPKIEIRMSLMEKIYSVLDEPLPEVQSYKDRNLNDRELVAFEKILEENDKVLIISDKSRLSQRLFKYRNDRLTYNFDWSQDPSKESPQNSICTEQVHESYIDNCEDGEEKDVWRIRFKNTASKV